MSVSEEIYGKVAGVPADSLNVDEDDITPTATLQVALGSRSTFWTSSSARSASSGSRSRAASCSPNPSSRATPTSCGKSR
jgi:hypothetical protein